jgi:hypothetical protein
MRKSRYSDSQIMTILKLNERCLDHTALSSLQQVVLE